MSPKDWKTLASFGLLVTALSLFDGRLALYMVGVASAVVIVKHADEIGRYLG